MRDRGGVFDPVRRAGLAMCRRKNRRRECDLPATLGTAHQQRGHAGEHAPAGTEQRSEAPTNIGEGLHQSFEARWPRATLQELKAFIEYEGVVDAIECA